MSEQFVEQVEVDVCGQICPSSLLTALREINRYKQQLRSGELKLDILTDNHDSTNRVCEAVSNMGYQVVVKDMNKHFRISIAKKTIK